MLAWREAAREAAASLGAVHGDPVHLLDPAEYNLKLNPADFSDFVSEFWCFDNQRLPAVGALESRARSDRAVPTCAQGCCAADVSQRASKIR